MPSTKIPVSHDTDFDGMSQGFRPHLIPERQWFRSFGMRHFETIVSQVPRKRELFAVLSNTVYPLSLLVNVPAGYENYGTVVGLTDSAAWRLTSTGATLVDDGRLDTDGRIRRFGHTLYNNRLFFVNPLNRVRYTDGAIVRQLSNGPSGHYVEVFFEHVVVGRPIFNGTETPSRIQWSHLYNFDEWTPKTQTEADHFDCVEHQTDEGYVGLTGLRRLGPMLCTYTPSAIYVTRYVGLPRVFVTDAVVQDYGNGLPWTLAAIDRAHFFIDVKEKSFFRFDGGEVTEIGRPIKDYFFGNLTTDQTLQLRTYAYVDPLYKEIHWVYVSSASSGAYDREVVFNYRAGTWWTGPVEDVWSFCKGARRSRTVDELTGTIDALSGVVDDLSNASDVLGRVYGSSNGRLLREEVSGDAKADLLEQEVPELETKDTYYGDLEAHKEVDSMVIHSKYVDAEGLEVYTASRKHIDDTVTLTALGQLWTPSLVEQKLSLPRISGRVFRYKFRAKPTTEVVTTETRTKPSTSLSLRTEIVPIIIEEINTCSVYDGLPTTGGVYFEWQHRIYASPPPGGPQLVPVFTGLTALQSPWVHLTQQQRDDHIRFMLDRLPGANYFVAQYPGKSIVRLERLTFCFDVGVGNGYVFTEDPFVVEGTTAPVTVFGGHWYLVLVGVRTV